MPDLPHNLKLSSLHIEVAVELRRLQLTLVEILPVDTFEPWVVLEGHESGSSQPPLRLVLVKQLFHELTGLLVLQRPRVFQLQIQNFLIDFERVFALFSEGHIATHKLKHINSQRV